MWLQPRQHVGCSLVCGVPPLPEHAGTGFSGESLEGARSKVYRAFR